MARFPSPAMMAIARARTDEAFNKLKDSSMDDANLRAALIGTYLLGIQDGASTTAKHCPIALCPLKRAPDFVHPPANHKVM